MNNKKIESDVLLEMSKLVNVEERDEMAIPSYTHPNFLLRWMAWRRIEVISRYIQIYGVKSDQERENSKVMDFGCGTGVLFDVESETFNTVYGVDIVLDPARFLVKERKYKNVELYHPDEAIGKIENDSLDVLVAAEVLEHISPLDDTLALFHKKLNKNGKLIITVPTENYLYRLGRQVAGFKDHFHVSNARSINKVIVSNGFKEVKIKKIPLFRPFDIYWLIIYDPVK